MQYFSVYTNDNERYVRDLAYRMMRDEDMTVKREGEREFVIVVMTKAEAEKWTGGNVR
jgi:protein involved in ribonucleotide reduction